MQGVNLIPVRRLEARRRRRRIRMWMTVCFGWALLLVAACVAARVTLGGGGRALADQIAAVSDDIHQNRTAIATLRPELIDARLTLETSRAVGNQPDWSVLLAVLSESLGDQVVLTNLSLSPAHADFGQPGMVMPQTSPQLTAAQPLVLKISAVARSQAAASQVTLRLEQTNLFDRVTLVDTHREPFLANQGIACRIECRIGHNSPPPSAAKASGANSSAGSQP